MDKFDNIRAQTLGCEGFDSVGGCKLFDGDRSIKNDSSDADVIVVEPQILE
jgi:hypothetical protein